MEPLAQPPRPRRAALLIAVPLALVMLLLVAVLVTRKSSAERADFSPLIDKPAPAIEGTTLDGKPFNVDSLRGEWVVVNFFATWCVPCQQEHADLLSFDRRHSQAQDAQLISVVFNDDTNAVRDYYARNGGSWPVVTGDLGHLALEYSVIRVPDTYIIDPVGIIRARIPRPVRNADELDQVITDLSQKLFGTSTIPTPTGGSEPASSSGG
jgi:cytochrome c biogenesis protein CcmG, thiol:disulfide interchange protein DsbE